MKKKSSVSLKWYFNKPPVESKEHLRPPPPPVEKPVEHATGRREKA
jgi:hypothetical protein